MASRSESNRQITLAKRPYGTITPDCFASVEAPVPELRAGQALVRNVLLSIDPTIRGWLERDTYLPAIGIGEVVRSGAVAQVIDSNSPIYPVGAHVFGMTGWQTYAMIDAENPVTVLPEGIELTDAVSVFGATGLTAYFGLLDVGEPKEGDTVLVSGAAGATGSIVGQIAKIKGCRVVGIAGTDEKCAWLTDELGFDATINYKTDDVDARIGELCPEGVDVFFDNVGGDTLEVALDHLALNARIVLCGAISTYNDTEPRPGPRNLMNLVTRRSRMEGFLLLDFIDRFAEAALQLAVWVGEGAISHRVDIIDGLEHAPEALDRLFSGANTGKVVVRV
jgi:NADPH-dependent curcumin reductase CurA